MKKIAHHTLSVIFACTTTIMAHAEEKKIEGCIGDAFRKIEIEIGKDGKYSLLASFPIQDQAIPNRHSVIEIENFDSINEKQGLNIKGYAVFKKITGNSERISINRAHRYATSSIAHEYELTQTKLTKGSYEVTIALKDSRCVIPMTDAQIIVAPTYQGK